jgi:hypothetical protein
MKFTVAILLGAASSVHAWGGYANSSIQTFPCLTGSYFKVYKNPTLIQLESQLDAQVPTCLQPCQKAALAEDGCSDYEDGTTIPLLSFIANLESVACHCAATGVIAPLLTACLAQSNCSSDDLNDLQNIVTPVCLYFNATTSGAIAKPVCSVGTSSSSPITGPTPPPLNVVTPGCSAPVTITSTIWLKPSGNSTVIKPPPSSAVYTGPAKVTVNAAIPTGVVEGGMLVLGVVVAFAF